MRLIELSFHFRSSTGQLTHADCLIGDPRTISPETSIELYFTDALRSIPQEWDALIVYTDLAEALEYRAKTNSRGFSLTQAYSTPGPISKFFKRIGAKISDTVNDMDQSEG